MSPFGSKTNKKNEKPGSGGFWGASRRLREHSTKNFINYVTILSVAGVILLDAAYDSREAAFRWKSLAQEISRNI